MKLFLSIPFSFSRQTKSTLLNFQKSAFLLLYWIGLPVRSHCSMPYLYSHCTSTHLGSTRFPCRPVDYMAAPIFPYRIHDVIIRIIFKLDSRFNSSVGIYIPDNKSSCNRINGTIFCNNFSRVFINIRANRLMCIAEIDSIFHLQRIFGIILLIQALNIGICRRSCAKSYS